MLPLESPDRICVAFDDHRLVANAGLLLPLTLAHHLGLGELVNKHLDLGDAPGRANTGDKLLTLVASALAGGDCIDDAGALFRRDRPGAGLRGQGAVHPGDLPAELQLGARSSAGSDELGVAARAWAAEAGPQSSTNHDPLTIDLDSTACEAYGLAKEGGRTAPQLRWPARLSPVVGRCCRHQSAYGGLMARLRKGRAQHGAGRSLTSCVKTVSRVRYAGATGQLTDAR